jgi:hypothetical protein
MSLYNVILQNFLRVPLQEFFNHPVVVAQLNQVISKYLSGGGQEPVPQGDPFDPQTGRLKSAFLEAVVTRMGNEFNGANQLLRLGPKGELPRLDGSKVFGISGSSTPTLPQNLTKMGNAFNSPNQLLKLEANDEELPALPAVDGSKLLNVLTEVFSGLSINEEGKPVLGGSQLEDDTEVPLNGKRFRFSGDGANYIDILPDSIVGLWQKLDIDGETPIETTSFKVTQSEFYYSHKLTDGRGSSFQVNEDLASFNSNDVAGNKVKLQLNNGDTSLVFSFTNADKTTTLGGMVKDGVLKFGMAAGDESTDFTGLEFGADGSIKVSGNTPVADGVDTDAIFMKDSTGTMRQMSLPALINLIREAIA